eukprot:g59585.t1
MADEVGASDVPESCKYNCCSVLYASDTPLSSLSRHLSSLSLDREVHSWANSLKQILRRLPESLLTTALLPHFLRASESGDVSALQNCVSSLPEANWCLLAELISICAEVVGNKEHSKVDARALAVVLGPNFLPDLNDHAMLKSCLKTMPPLFELLVQHREVIFRTRPLCVRHSDMSIDIYILRVHVERACQLRNSDYLSKSDPYCIVHVSDVLAKATGVVSDSLDPVWTSSNVFEFVLQRIPTTLRFQLMDHDRVQDDTLGEATLVLSGDLVDVATGAPRGHILPGDSVDVATGAPRGHILPVFHKHKQHGTLHVSISLRVLANYPFPHFPQPRDGRSPPTVIAAKFAEFSRLPSVRSPEPTPTRVSGKQGKQRFKEAFAALVAEKTEKTGEAEEKGEEGEELSDSSSEEGDTSEKKASGQEEMSSELESYVGQMGRDVLMRVLSGSAKGRRVLTYQVDCPAFVRSPSTAATLREKFIRLYKADNFEQFGRLNRRRSKIHCASVFPKDKSQYEKTLLVYNQKHSPWRNVLRNLSRVLQFIIFRPDCVLLHFNLHDLSKLKHHLTRAATHFRNFDGKSRVSAFQFDLKQMFIWLSHESVIHSVLFALTAMKVFTRDNKRSATFCDAFQISKQAWMGADNKLRFSVGWKRRNAKADFFFFSFDDITRIFLEEALQLQLP